MYSFLTGPRCIATSLDLTDPGLPLSLCYTAHRPLLLKVEIRLEMENKELPSEEKVIMVWTDVQPNAKNSMSLGIKRTETKQKAF